MELVKAVLSVSEYTELIRLFKLCRLHMQMNCFCMIIYAKIMQIYVKFMQNLCKVIGQKTKM